MTERDDSSEAPAAVIRKSGSAKATGARRRRRAAPGGASARQGGTTGQCSAKDPVWAELALEPVLAISAAGELKAALQRYLDAAEPLAIDASAVQGVDTAALQLFTAFARSMRAAGTPLRWAGVSSAFTDAVALLGLGAEIGLPVPGDA